jgi:uncharacterized protein YigE (DUF2233 family)
LLLLALLAGCTLAPVAQRTPSSGSGAAATSTPNTPTPDMHDTGWQALEPGVELRRLLVARPGSPRLAPVHIVRLEQQAVAFQVGYRPGAPRAFARWCDDAGLVAAINGGFFDADYRSTALVVHDGQTSGSSYQEQGGMFAVDVWGNVSLRYLPTIPYNPNEPLREAMQGWPMLIAPGGALAYSTADDGELARRSVIAMDRAGRVLLLAFPGSDFSLRGLAEWLHASDLDLNAALNLDGGSSTALCIRSGDVRERLDPFVPLPMVLRVYRR